MKPNLPSKWVKSVASSDPVYLAAEIALINRLSAVQTLFSLASERYDDDAEYVHLLRVWTRRASTAIKLYKEQTSRRERRTVLKWLRQIRRSANRARDCDVLIRRLEKSIYRREERRQKNCDEVHSNREPKRLKIDQQWLARLTIDRKKAQREIIKLHERLSRRDKLANAFHRLISSIATENRNSEIRFDQWAFQKLKSQAYQFHQSIPKDFRNLERLHQFRIETKSLRYAIELLAAPSPAALIEKLYPKIAELQEELGELNDWYVACQQLKEKQRSASGSKEKSIWRKLRLRRKQSLMKGVESLAAKLDELHLIPIRTELDQLLESIDAQWANSCATGK